jgi:hypothetical protein
MRPSNTFEGLPFFNNGSNEARALERAALALREEAEAHESPSRL